MAKVSIENKIRKLNNQVSKLQNEISKESKKAFKQMTKDIFKKYPDLKSFSWNQYTPYFNDGDICSFGVYIDYISINGSEEYECAFDIESLAEDVKDKDKTIAKLQKEMKKAPEWKIQHLEERIAEINNTDIQKITHKKNMFNDIIHCLSLMHENILKEMFGDHVSVIVTRKGITTEEYEHE